MPPSTTSSTNFLTVVFVSDESLAYEGFSAGYVTLNASTGKPQKHFHMYLPLKTRFYIEVESFFSVCLE